MSEMTESDVAALTDKVERYRLVTNLCRSPIPLLINLISQGRRQAGASSLLIIQNNIDFGSL